MSIRTVAFFVAGLLVGVALESGLAQERPITGLNHVALSVENFDAASTFYAKTMGLKEAFAFREADGTPYLTYFQINRDTFIELMPATREPSRGVRPRRPGGGEPGCHRQAPASGRHAGARPLRQPAHENADCRGDDATGHDHGAARNRARNRCIGK